MSGSSNSSVFHTQPAMDSRTFTDCLSFMLANLS